MRLLKMIAFCLLWPVMVSAQAQEKSDEILDILQLRALLEVMELEAIVSGDELVEGMIPVAARDSWRRTVTRINSAIRLEPIVRAEFAENLETTQAAPILEFFRSPQGEQIVVLELSARKALLHADIETMSLSMLDAARSDGDPRLEQVKRFAVVNDLVDENVVGALNANAAFLRGMNVDLGDSSFQPMSEQQILEEVWAQEPEIRRSTEDWVLSFLLLAYQPLEDNELEAYIAFSESPAGQALNHALFKAFDEIFVLTSEDTGEAMALALSSEDT